MRVVTLHAALKHGVALLKGNLSPFGLGFPCIDGEPKFFTGLSSITVPLERRKLAFRLSFDEGRDTLAGVMESREVDAATRC